MESVFVADVDVDVDVDVDDAVVDAAVEPTFGVVVGVDGVDTYYSIDQLLTLIQLERLQDF